MANRLRIARVEASLHRPLGEAAPGAEQHRRLDALIRRHLPAVTASLLAEPVPTADGRFLEWYSDLAGQPAALSALGEEARAAARTLLADRLRSLTGLAERLPQIDPANAPLAEALREAASFPGEDTVYVIGGQPVITFWGYRPTATAAPSTPAEPSPPLATEPAAAPGRRLPRALWPLLGLALLALIGAGLYAFTDLPWPPWGPNFPKLLQAAKDEDAALTRRIAELEGALRDELARCAAERALSAARAEETALQGRLAALAERLAEELTLCPLRQQLAAASDEGSKIQRRIDVLSGEVKKAIEACRRQREEAKRKAEEAARKKASAEKSKQEEARKKEDKETKEKKKEEGQRKVEDTEKKKAAAEKMPCIDEKGEVPKLDIYFLQDLTGSFDDDLPNMNRFMDDVVRRKAGGEFGNDVQFGIGSFTDKPHPVFGSPRHYVFRNHQNLSRDAGQLTANVRRLRTIDGGDRAESQYEAILEMVASAGRIGFRGDARKFVVVLTDAPPHVAGDWPPIPLLGSSRPDDGVGDGNPMDEDYPSSSQVAAALRKADITPIFLVAGSAIGSYQSLVGQLGRGASMPLSSDSSNVMNAMLAGLRKACKP